MSEEIELTESEQEELNNGVDLPPLEALGAENEQQ